MLSSENTRDGEDVHEPLQAWQPGCVEPRVGDEVGECCRATPVVDGVGDAKMYSAAERHRLDIAEEVVVEDTLSLDHVLSAQCIHDG